MGPSVPDGRTHRSFLHFQVHEYHAGAGKAGGGGGAESPTEILILPS